MLANGGSFQDYMGIEKIPMPGLPMIMIPTTAGTGAEATSNALLIDKKEKVKKSFVSSTLIPDVAIVDPELTSSLPQNVTAATGMDALAHCLESFISLRATPVTELFSLEGIRCISGSLREAYTSRGNIKARYAMTLGSLYGGGDGTDKCRNGCSPRPGLFHRWAVRGFPRDLQCHHGPLRHEV